MGKLGKRFPRYSKLLMLYPKNYRELYGDQMLQTLADMLDNSSSESERLTLWMKLAIDLPVSLTAQNINYFGGIIMHDSPKFVRRNGIIGGILLLPFFLALAANGLNKVVYNQNLFHSWLWSTTALLIWVIWLPLSAAILGLASLLVFLKRQTKAKHESTLKALLDIRYNWPVLAVALLGSFILFAVFFHDSVHCVTGNPIREAHNPHATWQCIQNS